MKQDETPLERTQRQVIEGELQVMAQVIHIGELVYQRNNTTEAETVLANLEDKLRALYKTLEMELERAKAARRQQ